MTVKELAEKLPKTEKNLCNGSFENICRDLDVAYYGIHEECELKAYFAHTTLSTDTHCGVRFYYLSNEPVCYSVKRMRGTPEEFYWFSCEAAAKTKNYLVALMDEEPCVRLIDAENEMPEAFSLDFVGEVIDWSLARYNGKPFIPAVMIPSGSTYCKEFLAWFGDDDCDIINIENVDFLYNLTENHINVELPETFKSFPCTAYPHRCPYHAESQKDCLKNCGILNPGTKDGGKNV